MAGPNHAHESMRAAAEFGFAILHPGPCDSAIKTGQRGWVPLAHFGVDVSVPGIVMVDLVVVEAVLVTPRYIVKRHACGLRRWWKGVNEFQIGRKSFCEL